MKCSNHPDKDAIGLCNRCSKSVCSDCHGEFNGELYCRNCLATKHTTEKSAEHSPALAAVLSLLIPGLGQFYNDQVGKGVLVFLTFCLIFPWILGIIDAYETAKKIKEGKVQHEKKTGCLITFVVMVMISWIAFFISILFLAIAIPNFMLAKISANENSAQANLKIISSALENYKAKNEGKYPTDEYQLISSRPPYFSQKYNGAEIKGYTFEEKLTPNSYTIIAAPVSCGFTGIKIFTVKNGGVISSQDCDGNDKR
jgi:TM2 domain-containing membrane protein YozV